MRRCLLAAAALALTLSAPAWAQSAYKAPRNAFGQPDLEGTWTNASLTSLERPAQFKSLTITEAQARTVEQMRARMMAAGDKPTDPNAPPPPAGNDPGGYNTAWIDPGTAMGRIGGEVRTSWIVEPADGKLPFSPAGKARFDSSLHKARTNFDGPEVRPLGERCVLGFGSTAGPPMMNVLYNNHYQVQQTRDHVVIVVEMNHDARVVRLGAKSHLPPAVTPWMGDSMGWWEGDTLVVETTNFHPQESLRPNFNASIFMSPRAKVTERFTRTSATQILYEFVVDDPETYTQAWRAQMPLNATHEAVYEYACHEGNYALPGILAGARKAEADGQAPEAVDLSE